MTETYVYKLPIYYNHTAITLHISDDVFTLHHQIFCLLHGPPHPSIVVLGTEGLDTAECECMHHIYTGWIEHITPSVRTLHTSDLYDPVKKRSISYVIHKLGEILSIAPFRFITLPETAKTTKNDADHFFVPTYNAMLFSCTGSWFRSAYEKNVHCMCQGDRCSYGCQLAQFDFIKLQQLAT